MLDFQKLKEQVQNIRRYSLHIIGGVACIALVFGLYSRHQYNQLKGDPQVEAQKITDNLIAEISKLVRVPEGEVPTIATISDVERLTGQPFFANAKNGDRVLIYSKAGKAILYRPSERIVIDIAPLSTPAE